MAELTLETCSVVEYDCGNEKFEMCIGKAPKSGRMLKKAKKECVDVSKGLKKDEIIISCGECR